jgi:hypothetical protein
MALLIFTAKPHLWAMLKSDPPEDALPLSKLLAQAVSEGDSEYVSIAELLSGVKTQALAIMLMLFALPNIPPSLPGTSAITGLPLVILTLQMTLGQTLWLPKIIANRAVPRAGLLGVLNWADPYFHKAERLLRPRGLILTTPAPKQVIGGLMLLLSILILLPIPLGNTVPSISIVIIAMGLAQRDGLFIIGGLTMACLAVIGLIVVYWSAFVWLLGMLFALAT